MGLSCNTVPALMGSPGIGKSDTIRSIAEEFKLKMIDIRLSMYEPPDIGGYPHPIPDPHNPGSQRFTHIPMMTIPLEHEPVPEGFAGFLVFFDELPQAEDAVQKACYKVILDRMLGMHKIHPSASSSLPGTL